MISMNENGIEVKRWERRWEDMEDMEGLAEKSGLRIPGPPVTTEQPWELLLFTPSSSIAYLHI